LEDPILTSNPPTARTRLRRLHERGRHDSDSIHAVLDAGLLCHIGYVVDGGPVVTPTLHWREGERVYWHGSAASRMVRHLAEGHPLCLTVSHFDGMVMARSAFHHSVNYRSAMLFGTARAITDPEAKTRHLKAFMERWFPGRWDELRSIHAQELKATTVLSMAIDEASTKMRAGPPKDDEEDYALPIWAGVLPLNTVVGEPEPCPRLAEGVAAPAYLRAFAPK